MNEPHTEHTIPTEGTKSTSLARELSLSNIHELTREPRNNLVIINVGAENKVSIASRGDKTLNIGRWEDPDKPLIFPEGMDKSKVTGSFYVHRGELQDLHDVFNTNIDPDLILVICPNPDDLRDLLPQVTEASGPRTSVVISLETDSAEMQDYGYDKAKRQVMGYLSKNFSDVVDEVSSLNEALEVAEIDRKGMANSRMNYGDKYEFIVAIA